MSLGNILGQILQQGMSGSGRSRLDQSVGPSGLGGIPGLGDVLGQVLGGGSRQGSAGGAGGLGSVLGQVLGGGGGARSGGGLGDLLGGVLGGGSRQAGGGGGLGDVLGGALGGGAAGRSASQASAPRSNPLNNAGVAILATIAMAALKNWTSNRAKSMSLTPRESAQAAAEFAQMSTPEVERLVLLAMINAAKADGEVDETEIQRIAGKIGEDGITAEEKAFVVGELRKPLDLQALVSAVPNEAVAAQVYGASLLAIDIDTPAEVQYLRQLAAALRLDAGTVSRLHELTGAQTV